MALPKVLQHIVNSVIHITSAERTSWNNHLSDTTKHITSTDSTNWNGHIADTTKHITAAERTAWNAKARTASPAFTGTPTAPTAAAGTNNTQVATTAFVQTAAATANPKYAMVSYSKTMASNADWVDDWCSIDMNKYNFLIVSYATSGFSFFMPKENRFLTFSNYNGMFMPELYDIPLEDKGVRSAGDEIQGYVGYSPHPTIAVRRDSNGIYYFSCNNKSTSNAERTMTVSAYCI